jgi:hypothetical protein
MNELMKTREVADHLRKSEETLRYWRARGIGPRSSRPGAGCCTSARTSTSGSPSSTSASPAVGHEPAAADPRDLGQVH